jgi:hypothetical protein
MKRAPIRIALPVLLALALASAAARAQDAAPPADPSAAPAPFAPTSARGGGFGATGQWVFTMQTAFGGTSGGFAFLHQQSGGGSEIDIHPAADTFITGSVSVGGVLNVDHDSGGNTNLGIGARAGFNLNIVDHVGFWPTAGVFANHFSGSDHSSNTTAWLGVFAPFLYHFVPHFFAGGGPSFDLSFDNSRANDYGIDFVIGGWI